MLSLCQSAAAPKNFILSSLLLPTGVPSTALFDPKTSIHPHGTALCAAGRRGGIAESPEELKIP
jgi:hypothetical protein